MPFKIDIKNDVIFIVGSIDERSDFSSLRDRGSPLILNFRHTTGINSLGIKLFLDFLEKYQSQVIEYHECQPFMIDALNIIPKFLGSRVDAKRVRSLMVPYVCASCQEPSVGHIAYEALTIGGKKVEAPSLVCPHCQGQMDADVDRDYFFFITG